MDGRGGTPRQYRGMVDCFCQVARKEGVAGLYKACTLAVVGAERGVCLKRALPRVPATLLS